MYFVNVEVQEGVVENVGMLTELQLVFRCIT